MYSDSHETLHTPEDTRTPEEIEQYNAELQAGLNDMYSLDRMQSDRAGFDEQKVFDAMDSNNQHPTDAAREGVAQVYSEVLAQTPESATIYAQEATVTQHASATAGEAIDTRDVAVRVGAEVINNIADGSVDAHNRAILSSEDMTKVERATTAANLIERIESGDGTLKQFTGSTVGRLGGFLQMVRSRGGVEKTSNKDLAEAGRYIEAASEVQQEVSEAEKGAEQLDVTALATAWVIGDELTVQREARGLPEDVRGSIEAYIAARRGELESHEAEIVRDVSEMIAEATKDS